MTVSFDLDLPGDLNRFKLPGGVHSRLQRLLDRQDAGIALTAEERAEAEGLVNLAELLTALQARCIRAAG